MDSPEMSLSQHLEELRTRFLWMIAVVGACFIAGYFVAKPVMLWLVRRSILHHLVVIGVVEAFYGVIQIDFIMSLIVSSPFLLFQLAAFVFPGLTDLERRMVGWFLVPGGLLFLAGSAAGFFWFVPVVLRVMLSFTGHGLEPLWTLSSYLSFVIDLSVPFGIVAELPLVSGLLSHYGILSPSLFARYRRYAILIAFAIAAVLAPPTALSMILMAIPIYLIYELAYVVSRLAYRPGARGGVVEK